MAFTSQSHGEIGQYQHECHIAAFTTTATTIEVPTKLKRLKGFAINAVGSPNANEKFSVDETVSDFGEVIVPDGGFVTVKRAAGTTSGLIISVTFFGY